MGISDLPLFTFPEQTLGKILRGYGELNPSQKDRFVRDAIEELRREGKLRNWPELPDLDEIVRVPPKWLTENWAEYEKFRGREIAQRIATGPTPPEVRAWGSFLNAIDDVQDISILIAALARMAVWAAPRVLSRFVPGINVIVTIGDVLNLLSAFMTGAAIATGVASVGATGAGAPAITGFATKILFKRKLWQLLSRSSTKSLTRITLQTPLSKIWSGSVVIQSLQATESLFGVGLSIGGIIGALTDLGWGVWRTVVGGLPESTEALRKTLIEAIPEEYIKLSELTGQRLRA